MKNFFSFAVVLTLAGAPLAVMAQTDVPARTAVAVDDAPAQPQPVQEAAPVVVEEEEVNVVLFTGTIKQEKLKALPGATVYVKSTRQMAVADENGDFSLELDFSNGPLDLEVSYAGFTDQSVTITDPNTFLVISMQDRKKKK